MKIEIFQERTASGKLRKQWRWHFKNKGRVTAGGEGHPTPAKAIRAATGVMRAAAKMMGQPQPLFTEVYSLDPKTGERKVHLELEEEFC